VSVSSYNDILRSAAWRRPVAGSLIGRTPESVVSFALVLLTHEKTGSYISAGLVTAGFGLGSAVAGPLAGRALDRLGQRDVLIALALAFATLLTALVLSAGHVPVAATVALAAVVGLTRPPLESAMRALWARIVSAEQLQAAYILDAIGQDLVWTMGPLLLALLLALGSAGDALVACAIACALGTVAYATAPDVPRRHHAAEQHDEEVRGRLRSRPLVALLAAAALYGVSMGGFEIALTAFCADQNAKPALGVLLAIWSAGSILGGLAYGARTWTTPPAQRTVALLAAIAVLLALLTLPGSVPAMGLLLFVLGLPFAPFTGTLSAAVQTLAPADRATEGFTWITAVTTTGIAAGNAAAGPLTQSHVALGFGFCATAAAVGAVLGVAGVRSPGR
jgi:predicted MFS family arabinose efflux permease